MRERGPPDTDIAEEFAETLRNAPTDEKVYRVAIGLTEPTTVSEIADRAECSKNAARRHLNRYVDIGILTAVRRNPDLYERNESFFEWRRLDRLANLSDEEYRDRLTSLLDEDASYKDTYGFDEPDALNPLDYGDYGDAESVSLEISTWRAVRREIRDLRRTHADDAVDEGVV